MKCPVCNHDSWWDEADYCKNCKITGNAIRLGPSRMRRISKRFRYLNAKKLKKRRKHGRVAPAPSRLVMNRSRLRGSLAAQLARSQADTLRTGQPPPETSQGRSGLQDDVGRE